MSQAKSLTDQDIEKVLRYIDANKNAIRNKTIFYVSLYAGLRAKEIAALTIVNVLNSDGSIKSEVRLSAEQTKGRHPRTIYLSQKLRDELAYYLKFKSVLFPERPLFATRCSIGFTANTMTQHLWWMYRKAGVFGASSHSGRRSMLTRLSQKGVGVRVLAELAGHRNIQVTMKYIDTNPAMLSAAVNLM